MSLYNYNFALYISYYYLHVYCSHCFSSAQYAVYSVGLFLSMLHVHVQYNNMYINIVEFVLNAQVLPVMVNSITCVLRVIHVPCPYCKCGPMYGINMPRFVRMPFLQCLLQNVW